MFSSRVVSLLVLSISLFGFQPAQAAEIKEIDIASMSACPVSLQSVWSEYGVPHPCFTQGSSLKIKVPQSKLAVSEIRVLVNGNEFFSTAGGFFSVQGSELGLNKITFQAQRGNSGNYIELSSTRFIIYEESISSRAVSPSKSSYVITLASGVAIEDVISLLQISSNEYLIQSASGTEDSQLASIFVADLSPEQYVQASNSSLIEKVFLEDIIQRGATQNNPSWGLDRIDQFSVTGDSKYNYNYTGAGVDMYIIDSGIRLDHSEFTNRITDYWYLTALGTVEDCDGHGTHVASTAAGTTYGVAKSANIIPMRAMDCTGSGSLSGIVAMINKAIELHASTTPAVLNMSLGAGYNSAFNSYVQAAINDGIVVVVAAGNDGADACNYSPASAFNAITVGASTSVDQDAVFSNIGTCVDIFAPGASIVAAGISSSSATAVLSGTSMASPFVAGSAALTLEKNFSSYSNKLSANELVRSSLVTNSIPWALSDSSGQNGWWPDTPNSLLNLSFLTLQNQTTLQISNANLSVTTGVATTLTTTGGLGTGAVTYRSFSTECVISGNTLTITVKRVCEVLAGKAQDSTYNFATSAVVEFSSGQNQASLVLAGSSLFGNIGTPIDLTVTGGSGTGATSLNLVSGSCRVVGMRLLAFGEGSCVVSATKAADADYNSATSEVQSFTFGQTLLNGPWNSVSAGGGTTCAITKATGQLYCWGLNNSGQIGQPVSTSSVYDPNPSPQLVVGIPGRVTDVSVGNSHTCAVNSFSNLYCWGNNSYGELGDNSLVSRSVPESVTSLSANAKQVSVGNFFTCVATLDGKAFCWGAGGSGQIGNGGAANVKIPTLVSGLTSGISQISAGMDHACAIQAGSVLCWGYGSLGSLGNGGASSSTTPVSVTGLTSGFTKVVSGSGYSCAIKSTASYCWGDNTEGALGDGTNTQRNSPITLSGSVAVVKDISASYGTTCAIVAGGQSFCWGRNASWNIGNNSITNAQIKVPTAVLGLTSGVTSLEMSDSNSCALGEYGRLFCWGSNSYGGLGNGSTDSSRTLHQVSQLDYNLEQPRIPVFENSSIVRQLTSFQIPISNFDAAYIWGVRSSIDTATVTISPSGLVSVAGLAPGTSSTLTATASRIGFETGTTVSSVITNLSTGLIPTFDSSSATSTQSGFEINLSNYSSSYQWSGASTLQGASVAISNLGKVSVSGLAPGTASRVIITTSRSGYSNESSTSLSYSSITGQALVPILDSTTAVATGDGFQFNITNYDNLYTWIGRSSLEGAAATVSNTGRVTVTGVAPATASTVTVTTSRTGYHSGVETSTAITSLLAGLLPILETSTPTLDGFTILISNFNAIETWTATSSFAGASAVINASGLVTVTNVTTGTPSRVTVTTSRAGYGSRSTTSESVTSLASDVATLSAWTINGTNVLPANSSVNVAWNVTSTTMVVTPTSAFASIVIQGNSGLVTGANTITVLVTSQSGVNTESYTATVNVAAPPPPPPPPPPLPPSGGGGFGGALPVALTAFNLFISSPDDATKPYQGEACALFILKSASGDQEVGSACASNIGLLDFEAKDGDYIIKTFDKAFPKFYKEYSAKFGSGAFDLPGTGFTSGPVIRRIITVLKASERPVEIVPPPAPAETSTPIVTPPQEPIETKSEEPTPTELVVPKVVPTMANNGLVAIVKKSKSTKVFNATATSATVAIKKNGTLAITLPQIVPKSSLKVTLTLPSKEVVTVVNIAKSSSKSYAMPVLEFKKPGTYTVKMVMGKTTKTLTITVK